MTHYILSQDADRDLDSVWEYIAADNVEAADRWIDKLFDAFDAIGKTPGLGHKREDLTAYPVLFWPVATTSSSIVILPHYVPLRLWLWSRDLVIFRIIYSRMPIFSACKVGLDAGKSRWRLS